MDIKKHFDGKWMVNTSFDTETQKQGFNCRFSTELVESFL
jgi:hypothetical protein